MINGSPDAQWIDMFPAPDAAYIMNYVVYTWNDLMASYPGAHPFSKKETALTDSLCLALNEIGRKQRFRIIGDFQVERWNLERLESGVSKRISRTDISFVLGAFGSPILVFEFKKLNGSRPARVKYCDEGLARFVSGKYSPNQQIGVMCAISKANGSPEETSLRQFIETPPRPALLSCLTFPEGGHVRQPSALAPGCAEFDTSHSRSAGPPIEIAHLILRSASS